MAIQNRWIRYFGKLFNESMEEELLFGVLHNSGDDRNLTYSSRIRLPEVEYALKMMRNIVKRLDLKVF